MAALGALSSSFMCKELTCSLVRAWDFAGGLCPAVAAPLTDLVLQLQDKPLVTLVLMGGLH